MRTLTEPRALLGVGLALLAMAACGSEEAPGSNEPAPGSNAADADVRGTPDGGQSDGASPTPRLDASVDAASDAEVDADASARDLSTDPKNCGAVGRDCLGGACQAGVCQPTVVRTDVSTYALGASDVYVGTTWTSQAGRIVAVPKDGTAEKLLAANVQAVGVVTDGRFVYWATGGTNSGFSLWAASVQGAPSPRSVAVPLGTYLGGLSLAGSDLWWAFDTGEGGPPGSSHVASHVATTAALGVGAVLPQLGTSVSTAFSNGTTAFYVMPSGGSNVRAVPATGSGITLPDDADTTANTWTADASSFYGCRHVSPSGLPERDEVVSIPLNGGAPTYLYQAPGAILQTLGPIRGTSRIRYADARTVVDRGDVYCTSLAGVFRWSKTGGALVKVASFDTLQTRPSWAVTDVQVDTEAVYWLEDVTHTLYRVRK